MSSGPRLSTLGRRVVVTGGAGFIGSHTVEALVSRGYEVVVVDDLSSGLIQNLSSVADRIVFVRRSILDSEALDYALNGADAVIHLAAIVSVDEAYRDPVRAFQVNAYGTLLVLEAARRHDVPRVVYASSASVYGNPLELPIKETHPLSPLSVYGASKLAGEALVASYGESYGLSTVCLRYFNVYGPRMRPGDYAGVVYKFIDRVSRGEPPVIYGDGKQTRDFIYVGDVAEANIVALERGRGVYNIGTGRATSINDLAETIMELMGRRLEPVYTSPRPGDIRHSVACIDRALAELGWRPRTGLREGLRKTIEYFVSKKTA